MNKPALLWLCLIVLTTLSPNSVAQTQTSRTTSPDSVWVKPTSIENVVDAVNPYGSSTIAYRARINLFDYPRHTVTYLLNGKRTRRNKAKRILAGEGTTIEWIFIGAPDEVGKRTIEIEYQRPSSGTPRYVQLPETREKKSNL